MATEELLSDATPYSAHERGMSSCTTALWQSLTITAFFSEVLQQQ